MVSGPRIEKLELSSAMMLVRIGGTVLLLVGAVGAVVALLWRRSAARDCLQSQRQGIPSVGLFVSNPTGAATELKSGPSLEEQIRRRAHDIWLQRKDQAGSALDDWLQAEKEISAIRSQASSEQ
jgi:hypothetical protein